MQLIPAKERIVIPLDMDDVSKAAGTVQALSPHVGCFKVGLELIHAILASLICPLADTAHRNLNTVRTLFNLLGKNVFWDGKFDDIPNTVGGAAALVNQIGVKWLNVHASAGLAAIKAAVDRAPDCQVLGVTVLTSLDEAQCVSIFGENPPTKVLDFADFLLQSGAHGIICSPQEVALIRGESSFNQLTIVTPGVRPTWAAVGDQKRVMTPGEAIAAGADFLVIGRPISQPPPEIGGSLKAVQLIAAEIEQALTAKAA